MIRKGAGAIVVYEDKILLVEKVMLMHAISGPMKIDPEWGIPKGGITLREDAITAIRRELHEEAGINKVKFEKILPSYHEHFSKERKKLLGFEGQENKMALFTYYGTSMSFVPRDIEIRSARFFSHDKACGLVSSSLKEYILSLGKIIF